MVIQIDLLISQKSSKKLEMTQQFYLALEFLKLKCNVEVIATLTAVKLTNVISITTT